MPKRPAASHHIGVDVGADQQPAARSVEPFDIGRRQHGARADERRRRQGARDRLDGAERVPAS
jgi:hypothetical protein